MLRVFISHSAGDDPNPEASELLTALTAALRDDFAVRVDREDLRPGVNWRSTINYWVDHCDAAVVLLSEKALKSTYVAYEVTLLTARMRARKTVTVIPVYLTGVGYKKVQESPLSPSVVGDVHSIVNEPDQARRVERVKEELLRVARNNIPINTQTRMLADSLRHIPVEKIRRLLERLEPDPWAEDDDPHRTLAVRMMSLGIEGAAEVIRDLPEVLMNESKLNEVYGLVAVSWVDAEAAEYVKGVAAAEQDSRALATNGTQTLIAQLYVSRASEKEPGISWTVAETHGIDSEDAFDQLKQDIEKAITGALGLPTDMTLQEGLDVYEANNEPVFVTLPAAGLDRVLLQKLRAAFPTVTFFLRAGGPDNQETLGDTKVKFIRPHLGKEFEAGFCSAYDKRRKILKLLAARPSPAGG